MIKFKKLFNGVKNNLFKNFFWIPACAGMTIAVSLFFAESAKADTATTTIRLQIKTYDASLYDADIAVTACPEADGSATSTINIRCAVDQAGLADPGDWIFGGTFLNSLKGAYASDYVNNIYWGWLSNLEYGQVSMTQHILVDGEKILLTYNINPLKISTDNAVPYVNATSTIKLEQFGLDLSWSPIWSSAASSTLVIDGQNYDNATGTYDYLATTTGEHIIYGKKTGYLDSEPITITAQALPVGKPTPAPTGGSVIIIPSSGGGGAPIVTEKIDLAKAADFLTANQKADGSYNSALLTDWSAIAIASVNPNGAAGQKIKNYLLSDPDPLAGLNPVSDYARRALALMSLSISPYDGVKTNYIKKITNSFDGRQFGDASLYNDDIFALLVLNKAGFGASEDMVKQTVGFILEKQATNGAWSGVDLTAAAVQTLKPWETVGGVSTALAKARSFLAASQKGDGGFGNSFTTSWAMQATAALGEEPDDWRQNNLSAQSFLASKQGEDGGLEKSDAYLDNRIWATAYAMPAVQKKTWSSLMASFLKPAEPAPLNNLAGVNDQPIATSTVESLAVASSTPPVPELATTTPVVTNEIKAVESVVTTPEISKQVAGAPAAAVIVTKPKIIKPKISLTKPQVKGTEEVKKPEPVNQPAVVEQPKDIRTEEKITINNLTQTAKKTFSAIREAITAGFLFLLKLLTGLL